MTPEELANSLEDSSLRAIRRLNKIVISTQNEAYGRVVVTLKKLDLDSQGYIKQTSANRAIIREANRAFIKAFRQSGYAEALQNFTVAFSVVDDLNAEFFQSVKGFNPSKQYIRSLQRQAVSDIETTLLNTGLEAQINVPLSQILNQNVNSGGSFTGLLKQVQDYIKGDEETDGKLLRYVKQITKDVLFNYSRSYQQAVASDLGLEFYMYVGGIMDTTRSFCKERAGKFFHHKEIEGWASQEWAGKRADTTESSIFVYAGGYQCLHSIIPVSVIFVPEEVIQRAIQKGFYKQKKAVAA